jgi:hypothetical protein
MSDNCWRRPSEEPDCEPGQMVEVIAIVKFNDLSLCVTTYIWFWGGTEFSRRGWNSLEYYKEFVAWMPIPNFVWPDGSKMK